MKEAQVIIRCINMLKKHPHRKHWSYKAQKEADGMCEILISAKQKLKRAEEFGGVDQLISTVLNAPQKHDLFTVTTPEITSDFKNI